MYRIPQILKCLSEKLIFDWRNEYKTFEAKFDFSALFGEKSDDLWITKVGLNEPFGDWETILVDSDDVGEVVAESRPGGDEQSHDEGDDPADSEGFDGPKD